MMEGTTDCIRPLTKRMGYRLIVEHEVALAAQNAENK